MELPPELPTLPPQYRDLSLHDFLELILRAYPEVESVAKELADMSSEKAQAFHHYMVKEHYSGIKLLQRGLTYYITRVSNIRNTAGYEQYTSMLWNKADTANSQDNPAISYCLFRSRWKEWTPIKHDI